jgi:hypothetical protein
VRTLESSPNLTALYGKALLSGFARRGDELPDTGYELTGVAVDAEHLAAYDRVCGFRLSEELPLTYPQVLSLPLQVKLMTDPGFPFPLVGSVHLANRITRTRPLGRGERLGIRVRVENLRPHRKGRQFDVVTEVRSDEDPGGEVVSTGVSTYLRRGKGSGEREPATRDDPPRPTATWRVPADTGRRYAEVSGDRNPIHLYPLTARLFGFPRAIAHGMWTKARCLAGFEGRLPDSCTVDVRFQRPVLLPATVCLAVRRTDVGADFRLFGAHGGESHLTGTITRRP